MPPRIFAGLLLLATVPCVCQDTAPPTLSGYVTRFAAPADLDVNGKHILLSAKTKSQLLTTFAGQQQYEVLTHDSLKPYLGQPVDVYGQIDSKGQSIAATRIVLRSREPHPIDGTAIVDALLPLAAGAASSTDRLLRADGYPILLTAKTKTTYEKPLASASDVQPNVWITYRGVRRPDGVVVASKVSFRKNTTSRSLDKLREKWEYDPNAIDPDTHQVFVDKAFRGIDPKQIPPHKDDAMQARVNAIGARLVPKYQADMSETEETRIDFRFYLIDMPHWLDAMPLPNGIILVPYQLVDRMQNDSQLAAVLADKVACLLEKHPVMLPATDGDLAVGAAELAARVAFPPFGLAFDAVTLPGSIAGYKQFRMNEEQRSRVSLSLLHDAGYDLTQAPMAWWILASKKEKDLQDISMNRHTQLLYASLGDIWMSETPPAQAPPTSPQPSTP